MPQRPAVIYRHVGNAAADIHDSHTLVLLVGRDDRVGHDGRIGEHALDLDARIQKDAAQTVLGHVLAEDEVVGRRELLAVTPDGISHLDTRIAAIAYGEEIHYHLAVGRLDVAHTLHQGIDVALRDAVVDILDKDVIRIACAAHELARDAHIGIRDGNAGLLLGAFAGMPQRLPYRLAVVDHTCRDSLGRLRHQRLDIQHTALGHGPDGYDHIGRTHIDRYNVTLLVHLVHYALLVLHSTRRRPTSVKDTAGRIICGTPPDPCT